ncbi:hypothetical protein JAAARDRAFT_53305 [Jaapia argillacea MUCL 33604]|uniref:Uncharacterized protein n=1 Tax=Jaapia argillacea MUCL 33604 TaxID=933084 RepID=A0A067Q7Y9_9AGAM|nr:hypothetical protein JAAARDRAFT_53305 [Jaapia argillacea MUCL 33604]
MTTDFNKARSGDYLYLVWKTLTVKSPTGTFVCGIQAVWGKHLTEAPRNAITDLIGSIDDVNDGYDGGHLWLVAQFADDPHSACTNFNFVAQGGKDDRYQSLTHDSARDFRYLVPRCDSLVGTKISAVRLLRSNVAQNSPPEGFDGLTGDINKGRSGAYLYLVWQTQTASLRYISGFKVIYGHSSSEEPAGALSEVNDKSRNINEGFGGLHVWVVVDEIADETLACTSFEVVTIDTAMQAYKTWLRVQEAIIATSSPSLIKEIHTRSHEFSC